MRPDRRTDGQTDGETDRQTDGHGDSSIPPPNFVAGGIIRELSKCIWCITEHFNSIKEQSSLIQLETSLIN